VKGTFLFAIGVFELGSLICGAAPSSVALIVGRAIAGIGVGGIFSGALVISAYAGSLLFSFPPERLLTYGLKKFLFTVDP
jgi:MFS family permease